MSQRQLRPERLMTFKKTLTAAALAIAICLPFSFDTAHSTGKPGTDFRQVGTASWYGPGLHGKKTASGARFDQNKLTAAHRSLPLNTVVKVTNLENGKAVKVKVNDRGPYAKKRVIDLSRAAARKLDMTDDGTARVRIEVAEYPASDQTASSN
ncbi:septal ring lytic transglycosylase RlpA family protein [Skermanella sp. TT6]|uniref:Endolytic peptidoglycan transglycosylase RlpA n=2 Tax=Skermanella cutis TaxID=2775420 RepID=A0ABX7B762_9PROT|nr:septal ring lytic transglycosylase RlpA family protein [Skermanella sp. TT6]